MWNKTKVILLIIISVFIVSCNQNNENIIDTNITISKNFGQTIDKKYIKESKLKTVLEITSNNFEVETAYNGGFINSINSLKSGYTDKKQKEKKDWFYYVNGYLANIGSDEYFIKKGDNIIWDYHTWKSGNYTQAIIGAYPKNFTNGYNGKSLPTKLYYTLNKKEDILDLKKQINFSSIEKIEDLNKDFLTNTKNHTFIIGSVKDLENTEFLEKIFNNFKKKGLYGIIDKEKIITFSSNYKNKKIYDKGTIIVPMIKSYGEYSTVWLVLSLDKESLYKSIDILSNRPKEIRGMFSAYINDKNIISLPEKEE